MAFLAPLAGELAPSLLGAALTSGDGCAMRRGRGFLNEIPFVRLINKGIDAIPTGKKGKNEVWFF